MRSTLLRIGLAVVAMGYAAAAGAVLALVGAEDASERVAQIFGLTGLVLPPLFGGLTVVYWPWTGADARRAARRILVVLLAVQVTGAIAILVPVAVSPRSAPAVLLVLAAAVIDAVVVLLGRAARRAEGADPSPPAIGSIEDVVRRARRNGAVGGAVGFAVAVLLVVGLAALPPASVPSPSGTELGLAVGLMLVGGAVGLTTGSLDAAAIGRSILGTDLASARRIGRAVRGRREALDAETAERAARIAHLSSVWSPVQLTASGLMLIGILALSGGTLLEDGPDPLRLATLVIIGLTAVLLFPAGIVRIRRVRTYAAAHPVA